MHQVELEDRATLAGVAYRHERAALRSAVLATVYAAIGVGIVVATVGWVGLSTAVAPAAIVVFGVLPTRKRVESARKAYCAAKAALAQAEEEQWGAIGRRITVYGRFEANGSWHPGDAA